MSESRENTQKHKPFNRSTCNKFRISAKKLFLTYSQVDPEMTAEHVLQQLQNNFYGFNYIISKESHGGGEAHFHVILTNKNKFNIQNADKLDVEFDGKVFHGNYQAVKILPKVVEYVCKGKDYITNLTNLQDGKLLDDKDFLLQRIQDIGYEKALAEYIRQYPKKALSGSSASVLMKNIRAAKQAMREAQDPVLETPFEMQHFNLTGRLQRWAGNPKLYKKKALILVGRSGIGKTEFAKVFCLQHKWKTLVVSHNEDFQKLDESYDAVIIDDSNFNDFSDSQKLAIINTTVDKTIRVLYKTVTRKMGTVTMILMNHKQYQEIHQIIQQEPFARRVVTVEPNEPFMINVNINIQNIHNGDVNHIQNISFQDMLEEDKQLIEENREAGEEICRRSKLF